MTLIDQRILVPAPIQVVWSVIANHSQLPRWRQDCKAVSLLSTRADGIGMRRRITPIKGKDLIEETIAWYDGLGYEYRLIDGANQFKSYTARLRLQPTPDGTIVQWTVSFETRGLLGKLFGNRRRRRKFEKTSAESLRQLRRYIEGMGIKIDHEYRQKVGVRSSPDANARQEYGAKLSAQHQPATSSAPITEPPLTTQSSQPTQPAQSTSSRLGIIEPPIKPDDTPSIRPVSPPSFIVDALMTPLPPTRKSQETPSVATFSEKSDEDTRPNPAVVIDKAPSVIAALPTKTAGTEATSAQKLGSPPPSAPSKSDEQKSGLTTAKISKSPLRPITDEVERDLPPRPDLPPPTGKLDTGEISIWEVFGMNPPLVDAASTGEEVSKADASSQSQTLNPPPSALPEVLPESAMIVATTLHSSSLDVWLAANEPPLPPSATGTLKTFARIPQRPTAGLRIRQRQRRLKVRRPMAPNAGNSHTTPK